jgi:hypothetical protein
MARRITRITHFRPDFSRTATGYVLLDFLTRPYWRWSARRQIRIFERRARAAGVVIPKKVRR